MNYPTRVIMPNGTVHTLRRFPSETTMAAWPGWARIERAGIIQPPPMIDGDNDG